ncbi:MAG: hypothetical protein OEV21_07265, partial [Thermoplasmata archaeon]|nr:hypothetical protein [Thermoplasmata archaeon]
KGSQTTKDKLYVLTENGQIRYTTDGGSTWSNLGNLPTPGGGNSSKYVSIAKDTDGNFWTITDTGWCFKSTDSGSTWTYTGRPTTSDIIALAAPIPEFESVMLPVVFMFVVIFVMRRYGRIKREAC